ncbi:MAG: branched-chain amino acid ABC transporter permease [Rhizobiales bacterium]|mgnify:CR=1 FL=1|nr:branched-chain amino acid ABC transporter permease [Hyphomicrobiales bacterium]
MQTDLQKATFAEIQTGNGALREASFSHPSRVVSIRIENFESGGLVDSQLVTQVLITSLLSGVVYGSVGLAFVTVYRVTSLINFPQADIGLAGALAAAAFGGGAWSAGLFIAALVSAAVSAAMFLLVVVPLRRATVLLQTIALIGAGIALQAIMQMLVGTGPRSLAPFVHGSPIMINGAAFPLQGLFVLGWGAILLVGLHVFFEKTMLGRAVRACAINPYAAGLVGIPVMVMSFVAYVIAGLISGLAITVQAPLSYLTVSAGLALALKGFIAAAIGGGERIVACMGAGLLLGILEGLVILWFPIAFQQIVVMLALLTVLMLRPSGIGRRAGHGV